MLKSIVSSLSLSLKTDAMKNPLLSLAILLIAILSSCSPKSKTPPSPLNSMSDEALCDSLRSWGAADAYVDDDRFLLYGVSDGQVNGDPDFVARQMYDLAVGMGLSDLEGCRVVVLPDFDVIGNYKP